jgi:hypothetical protein
VALGRRVDQSRVVEPQLRIRVAALVEQTHQ